MGKQKRSPNTYQKINAVFKRDEITKNIIVGSFCDDALEFLASQNMKFSASEKIDGTNIRLQVVPSPCYNNDTGEFKGVAFDVTYKGKTDNANLHPKLIEMLKERYPKEAVLNAFNLKEYIPIEDWHLHKWVDPETNVPDWNRIPEKYIVYGEGIGPKIRVKYWKDDRYDFVAFDVMIGSDYVRENVFLDIVRKLGAPIAPQLDEMLTIDEAIEIVKNGFVTQYGDSGALAEGLVLKTPICLKNNKGERLITKIKYKDFKYA